MDRTQDDRRDDGGPVPVAIYLEHPVPSVRFLVDVGVARPEIMLVSAMHELLDHSPFAELGPTGRVRAAEMFLSLMQEDLPDMNMARK